MCVALAHFEWCRVLQVWLLKNQEALTDGSASGTNASDVEAIHTVSA